MKKVILIAYAAFALSCEQMAAPPERPRGGDTPPAPTLQLPNIEHSISFRSISFVPSESGAIVYKVQGFKSGQWHDIADGLSYSGNIKKYNKYRIKGCLSYSTSVCAYSSDVVPGLTEGGLTIPLNTILGDGHILSKGSFSRNGNHLVVAVYTSHHQQDFCFVEEDPCPLEEQAYFLIPDEIAYFKASAPNWEFTQIATSTDQYEDIGQLIVSDDGGIVAFVSPFRGLVKAKFGSGSWSALTVPAGISGFDNHDFSFGRKLLATVDNGLLFVMYQNITNNKLYQYTNASTYSLTHDFDANVFGDIVGLDIFSDVFRVSFVFGGNSLKILSWDGNEYIDESLHTHTNDIFQNGGFLMDGNAWVAEEPKGILVPNESSFIEISDNYFSSQEPHSVVVNDYGNNLYLVISGKNDVIPIDSTFAQEVFGHSNGLLIKTANNFIVF